MIQLDTVASMTKVVIANPGETPDLVEIDLGGVLEFRNASKEFPQFEIEFRNSAPPCPDDTLTGSVDTPIFIHMPHEAATFEYSILYKHADGGVGARHEMKMAKSCGGCGH